MSNKRANQVGLLGPLAGSDDPVVDIVFIHGLTGHREKTWTGRYNTFWPKALLPQDIPKARIWTWGYDASIFHFFDKKSKNELDNYSKALCTDLAGARTSKPDRPIVFVVHSLGGIICQNAVVLATLNAEKHIKQIADCTRGIIFLGTPLRGSPKIKWVDVGNQFAKLIGQDKDTDVTAVLKEDSPRLQKLADDFANILRSRSKTDENIEVMFFYEQFPTGSLGHIVTKSSATVDGYEAQAIPANHSDIAKFDDRSEVGYIQIKVVLERWIKALQKTGQATPISGINVHQEVSRMLGGLVAGVIHGNPTIHSNYGADVQNKGDEKSLI